MLDGKYPYIRHLSQPNDSEHLANYNRTYTVDDCNKTYTSDTSLEGQLVSPMNVGGVTDDGYCTSTSSRTQQPEFWKMSGLSRFCIAPVKYRIQKLEALGLDTTKKNQESLNCRLPSPDSLPKDVLHKGHPLTHSMTDSLLPNNQSQPNLTSQSANSVTTQPLAFTVDLESAASDSSGSSGKRLDISASISQWVPKHRRNQSLTKVEENKKVEERPNGQDKPPLGRPRSGTITTPGLPPRKGGYHSEGYFSSDQEDDAIRRTELKSPRSPRCSENGIGVRPTNHAAVGKTMSLDLQKMPSSRRRPPSPAPPSTPPSPYSGTPLNEQASFLIEKILQATPELKRKQPTKPDVRQCCKERERKPSVSELTGKTYKNGSGKSTPDSRKQSRSSPTDPVDIDDDKDDDLSETGTYTVGKDSPQAERSQEEIARAFGINNESELELTTDLSLPLRNGISGADLVQSGTDVPQTDDSSWVSTTDLSKSKVGTTISRNSPNWIHQWAAHVAEQTNPSSTSDNLSKMAATRVTQQSPTLTSQESDSNRIRRKLPTPPLHMQNTPDVVDDITLKNRARLDPNKSSNPAFRNSTFESQESGGDSDLDPPFYNDDENLSASMQNKLRLSGLNGVKSRASSSPVSDSRTVRARTDSGLHRKNDYNVRTNSAVDMDYNLYGTTEEENVNSETSSEISDVYANVKEPLARADSNPPLKFNRAFSLRRARLEEAPKRPADKNKSTRSNNARPSSAGSSNRKTPLSSTKIYQSVDSPSRSVVKSPSKSNLRSGKKIPGNRSSSTLSAKEVDFQNWKRRKNYDPMRAAKEGKKKQLEKMNSSVIETLDQGLDESLSPSPPMSLLRSASFHGTEGGAASWQRRMNPATSEDDGPLSLDDDTQLSPARRYSHRENMINSPHRICPLPSTQVMGKIGRRTSMGQGEDSIVSPVRKISIDEMASEGKRSPMNGVSRNPQGSSQNSTSSRTKSKMEALDNLVISTIHSLSVKVRTSSETLLTKLKSHYTEEGDRAALLEEVLSHLSESDQSINSTQSRSTSRELAGILRNLKKIEQSLEVIDKVLVGEVVYTEDDLDNPPQDWMESDY